MEILSARRASERRAAPDVPANGRSRATPAAGAKGRLSGSSCPMLTDWTWRSLKRTEIPRRQHVGRPQ
eukprot:4272571-Pyramimonas_sp.AAC.1